ncbi:MAG: ABC transporter permease, partial [Brachybacterium tyrofermentans]
MSQLVRLLGRRLVALPLMILGVTLLVFVIMSLSPTDQARRALGESASEEALDLYREANGLNDPLLERYFSFLGGMLHGDLGTT